MVTARYKISKVDAVSNLTQDSTVYNALYITPLRYKLGGSFGTLENNRKLLEWYIRKRNNRTQANFQPATEGNEYA